MEDMDYKIDQPLSFLKEYCEFGENRVYILLAVARPKENPEVSYNKRPRFRRVVDSYESLERSYRVLSAIADGYSIPDIDEPLTFRIYITANARNSADAFFDFQEEVIELSSEIHRGHSASIDKTNNIDSMWLSNRQSSNKDDKLFIIDIDTENEFLLSEVKDELESFTEIKDVVETPNGFHLVVYPFNFNELECLDYNPVEIQRDSALFVEKR